MEIEVMPKEAGQASLRLCVYYRNQLLQSLGLKARVGPEIGETPAIARLLADGDVLPWTVIYDREFDPAIDPGKTQGDWGFDRPCLSVGSSEQPYILPDSLPDEGQWPERPLVFLNACRSVGLDPELLGGFVQAFVDHGAAGVIGTEVRVWEPLATAFAERFLEKFLTCEPVGVILRDLRHELLRCHNPLGLVYTNYCSADLHLILPAAPPEVSDDRLLGG